MQSDPRARQRRPARTDSDWRQHQPELRYADGNRQEQQTTQHHRQQRSVSEPPRKQIKRDLSRRKGLQRVEHGHPELDRLRRLLEASWLRSHRPVDQAVQDHDAVRSRKSVEQQVVGRVEGQQTQRRDCGRSQPDVAAQTDRGCLRGANSVLAHKGYRAVQETA